jgi:hypothetical protein
MQMPGPTTSLSTCSRLFPQKEHVSRLIRPNGFPAELLGRRRIDMTKNYRAAACEP